MRLHDLTITELVEILRALQIPVCIPNVNMGAREKVEAAVLNEILKRA